LFEAVNPARTSLPSDLIQALQHDEWLSALHRLLWLCRGDDEATAVCLATAKAVELGNGTRWRQAWQGVAERCAERAKAAAQADAAGQATRFWLQAANYQLAAAAGSDGDCAPNLLAAANRSVVQFLESLDPPGAAVSIPWREGRTLNALYCPVHGAGSDAAPVVICVAETRYSKDALVAALAPQARPRGIAVLCIEPGEPAATGPLDLRARPETAIVAAIDYVIDGLGVDPRRIAVMADGSPSSLVASGVALDGRIAAAVCDAGLWALWEGEHLGSSAARLASGKAAAAAALPCPTLVPLDARDGIDPAHARRLLASRYPRNGRIAVTAFGTTDVAGWEPDPVLAADAVFDWLRPLIDSSTDAGSDRARRQA
jgi:hypothetical protein